jgi:hypothetical protein
MNNWQLAVYTEDEAALPSEETTVP